MAIRLKEEGDFAGAIGFNEWNKQERKAEIGFWLLPEYWKKGYVTEALPVVIDIVKIRPGKN